LGDLTVVLETWHPGDLLPAGNDAWRRAPPLPAMATDVEIVNLAANRISPPFP